MSRTQLFSELASYEARICARTWVDRHGCVRDRTHRISSEIESPYLRDELPPNRISDAGSFFLNVYQAGCVKCFHHEM